MAADVATCRVQNCMYNQNMDCTAPSGISINLHEDHADCETFEEG